MQRKQRKKVENTHRKRNRTCSNLTQATQEVANDMAGNCHADGYVRCVRRVISLETGLN